ncbi:hypothetical protein IQ238_05410 [Pleurocapsales cyanobacterium LEGE 06147]|nr:hypothetical protein [Pleurocapsales cyanobacterium LEGE 06147]
MSARLGDMSIKYGSFHTIVRAVLTARTLFHHISSLGFIPVSLWHKELFSLEADDKLALIKLGQKKF